MLALANALLLIFKKRNIMHKDVRPLYTLTVEEFKELSKTIALDYRYLLLPDETVQESKSDIIYLNEAAELTGYTIKTIYSKVCRKEMPVISTGRPLAFSREEILQWIIDGRPTVAEMIAKEVTNRKNKNK